MLQETPGAGRIPSAAETDPLVESRFRYRLHDLNGNQVGILVRSGVLELGEIVVVSGARWRVVSTVGASARVSEA